MEKSKEMNPNSRPRRFLFVIDNLSTGGAQRQMGNLAVGLTRRGCQVELFCYAPGDLLARPLNDAGIRVHWSLKRSRFSPGSVVALRRLIAGGDFDLVLSFLSTPSFYALVAGRLLGFKHPPVVVSERFCDLPERVIWQDRLVRQLYRFATHIVTNSHHQHANLAGKYPHLKGRLSTIYNGYDLGLFAPAQSETDHAGLRLLVIASVSFYKNGLCLIEALNILGRQYRLYPQVTWIGQKVMTGERLACLNQMDAKISAYGLEKQWHWLGQRSDIVEQLHAHDVLVHPSYGEGLPNVVCEALACARPVILSNTLDHARLVRHNDNGLLFDYRSPDDLAAKINQFSELPLEARGAMGKSGRRYAEEYLSLDRFIDEYEHLFTRLLA